jgi:hypothetical protein
MSRSTQIIILALFIIGGAVFFGIGYDMFRFPSVYAYWSSIMSRTIGGLLMITAFIPTVVTMYLMLLWNREEEDDRELPSRPVAHLDLTPVPAAPGTPSTTSERTMMVGKTPSVEVDQETEGDFPHLIGLDGEVPARITLPKGTFVIGRSPECDLVLSSQLVSRRHASLEWDGENLKVTDLGSSNSTLINDKPIQQPIFLNEGDVIQIVECSLEVELPVSVSRTMIVPRKGSESLKPTQGSIRD